MGYLTSKALYLWFILTRSLTLGVRGICLGPESKTILLVQHAYTGEWSLPGGVEINEAAKWALQRELREEAGITCHDEKLVYCYHNTSISKRDHVLVYYVHDWTLDTTHKPPHLEIKNVAWFQLDDLPCEMTPCTKFALNEGIIQCLADRGSKA